MAIAVVLLADCALGCTSIDPPVETARRKADLVFRGVVSDIRDSGRGYKVAVFQVSRVWKGEVARVFEMPMVPDPKASPCVGFWPTLVEAGTDVLVYARKVNAHEYLTGNGSRTRPAKDNPDFSKLGPGRPPRTSN